MFKSIVIALCVSYVTLFASFEEGKKLFEQKCASCHKEFISFKKLKENFFERNNTLLNLTIPTENMLAWAITDSSKKIGDPEDPEMQAIEIEEYLKNYLENPDINDSICDTYALQYYVKKEPMKITDEEAELLTQYFMGYKKDRLKNAPKQATEEKVKSDDAILLKRAQKEGKNLMIYATSQSCYYCKKMKREVLDKKDVQLKLNENYIFVEVDVDFKKLPFRLQKAFKGMTPTFFVLDEQGTLLNTYPGAWVKDDFFEIMKENL